MPHTHRATVLVNVPGTPPEPRQAGPLRTFVQVTGMSLFQESRSGCCEPGPREHSGTSVLEGERGTGTLAR